MIPFLIGLLIGAAAGVVIACLAVAAADDDREGRDQS